MFCLIFSLFSFDKYKNTGNVQTFTAPITTSYKCECWGASGGYMLYNGAGAAYVLGLINITSNTTFYIFVGQAVNNAKPGGWNGGGTGSAANQEGTGGGGATDIRLSSGNWNDFNSLKSRIMVAAGGGGSGLNGGPNNKDNGGEGGTLNGIEGYDFTEWWVDGYNYWAATGGTQTAGGNSNNTIESIAINNNKVIIATSGVNKGGFGYGGSNLANIQYGFQHGASGGGGGYYGGGASTRGHGGGGGGSSFISGHTGCNAINSSSTSSNIVHTGQPNHYSGKVFTNTVMKAGNESMPSPTGGTETGHIGNGYCKITWQPAL